MMSRSCSDVQVLYRAAGYEFAVRVYGGRVYVSNKLQPGKGRES